MTHSGTHSTEVLMKSVVTGQRQVFLSVFLPDNIWGHMNNLTSEILQQIKKTSLVGFGGNRSRHSNNFPKLVLYNNRCRLKCSTLRSIYFYLKSNRLSQCY